MQLLDLNVKTLQKKMNDGDIFPYDVVCSCIDQIEQTHSWINALVENRFARAKEEAKKVSFHHGKKLAGVPISVKESFHVQGMKTTGGLPRRQYTQDEDAEVVRRLKNEGAIIIGKTNTPTLCYCQETVNKLYGRTNNPWNVERTAGGSSGGEAALVAVGGAFAGIGSDIGGSIRIPCHFNGVVGFKSGNGRVSDRGSFPELQHPLQKRMLGIGPITRSVRDARDLYDIIADEPLASFSEDDVKITVLPRLIDIPLTSEVEHAVIQVSDIFANYFSVERAVPPYFEESARLWQEIMAIDGAKPIARLAALSDKKKLTKTYFREKTRKDTDYHHYFTWALIGSNLFRPSKKRLKEITETIRRGDELLERYLEGRVLLFPVYHRGAPRHGQVYREIFSIKKTYLKYMPYLSYANVWGLASLTVPVAHDRDGMPIAVQLIGKNEHEAILFQLGEIIEKHFCGMRRCRRLDAERQVKI